MTARGWKPIRTGPGSCSSWSSGKPTLRRRRTTTNTSATFYDKSLHIAPEFFAAPGYMDFRSLDNTYRKGFMDQIASVTQDMKEWNYKDFIDNQLVIGGSPSSVVDQLEDAIKKLRVGNLMVLLHIGSMPHELTLKNIDLFGKEVLPKLRDIWDDDGWENHWWPEKLRGKRQLAGQASV